MKKECVNNLKVLHSSVFILILSFCCIHSNAQENYISGYIIKQNRDTINGFVDYRNWDKNPNTVKFKANTNNQYEVFNPLSIREFGVEDEIYVGGIIDVEVTSLETDKLKEDTELKIIKDTIFLQTLFQGSKSLYYYRNEDKRENYYIPKDEEFELLIYKKYLRRQSGKKVIVENKGYLGQLASYLDNCTTTHTQLVDAQYRQKDLYHIFEYYKECSTANFTFQKKAKKILANFGVVGGASFTSLSFKSVEFTSIVNTDYNLSIRPSLGLYVDFVLPRHQRKWSIYNELLFSNYKTGGVYEDYVNEDNYSISTTEFAYSQLRVNNFVRFKYPAGSIQIFVNGGISNSFVVSGANYKKRETKFFVDERVAEGNALNDIRIYEQGYMLGTGIKKDNYTFEFRAERSNGISKYVILKSIVNRFYVLFGYKF